MGQISRKTAVVTAVRLLSHVRLFATPWTAARWAPLSFTVVQSLLKFMSIESMMPSSHLILCHPLLLLPSIFPSIRVFERLLRVSNFTKVQSLSRRKKKKNCPRVFALQSDSHLLRALIFLRGIRELTGTLCCLHHL